MPVQPSFTLGIEEEFQVVDPVSRELKSHIHELFAEGEKRLKDEIKREMHDAVIEVGTPICKDIAHARREITRLRREIITLTRENGLCIAAAGTHPISHWANVPITPHAPGLTSCVLVIPRPSSLTVTTRGKSAPGVTRSPAGSSNVSERNGTPAGNTRICVLRFTISGKANAVPSTSASMITGVSDVTVSAT